MYYFIPKRDEKLANVAVRLDPWAADVSLNWSVCGSVHQQQAQCQYIKQG